MVLLPALWFGGCADTMPEVKPLSRFTDLVRGYDHTLTKAEKKAAISELQEDKERQKEQLGLDKDAAKTN